MTRAPASESQPAKRSNVEAHLKAILASPEFQNSDRCRQFLEFVVGRALDGAGDSIKERVIGVEVFGRPEAYDTGQDAIVRVKAAEVRRRLQRFYARCGEEEPVRIELPVGSYAPQFQWAEPLQPGLPPAPLPELEAPTARRSKVPWIALTALLCLLLAGVAGFSLFKRSTNIDVLWEPVLRSAQPLLICIPSIRALETAEVARATELFEQPPAPRDRQGRAIVNGAQWPMRLKGDLIGMGAAQAALRVGAYLSGHSHAYVVKIGQDVSFADLRNHPALLLGGFSSQWTMEFSRELRFVLVRDSDDERILDARQNGRVWRAGGYDARGWPSDDYAIAARIFDSKTGAPVFLAAGISTFGTQAAAEFLMDPVRFGALVARAPGDWKHKNLQAVIHTRILGNTPSPPDLVDVHFW